MYLLRRIEAAMVKELNNMKVLPVTHKHSICGRNDMELQGGPLERKRKNAPSRKKSLGYYNKANKSGTGAKAGGGMSQKGVSKYRRDNPGSKLKTAVTTPPSKLKKGSKAAKRRKSFCARSKSWKSERGRAARRRWNC